MTNTIRRSEPYLSVRRLVLGMAVMLVLLIGMWYPLLLVSAASKPLHSSQLSIDSAAQPCLRQSVGAAQSDWLSGRPQITCSATPHVTSGAQR